MNTETARPVEKYSGSFIDRGNDSEVNSRMER